MTEIEKQMLYKKIALRFFKETGFYNAWKRYIKIDNKKLTWYRVHNIDEIFQKTYFGRFLREQYGIDVESKFGPMFKKYLSIAHKELYSSGFYDADGINIEELTGRATVLSHKL